MHSALFLTLFLSAFSALAMALPIGIHGRATGARQFSAFTIANGVGGNALAEAKAAFPGTASTLSAAQTSAFNSDAHCSVLAEQAFLDDGAIASSNKATNSISVGLFKNKVLKIYGTMLVLQAEIAQNGGTVTSDQQAQLDDLTTKLAANVKVDQTNAGLTSTSADFTC